jgi:hypothetical protein
MAVVLWQGARLVTPHRCGGTCGAGVSIDHHHCRSQRALELTLETHRLGLYYVGMEVDLRSTFGDAAEVGSCFVVGSA